MYDAWGQSQPNDKYPNENALHFWDEIAPFRDATWNDVTKEYNNTIAYVVEYVPEPATLSLLALGAMLTAGKRNPDSYI